MSTRMPDLLQAPPADRWNFRLHSNGGDPDEGTAWTLATVDAESAEVAELRVLLVLNFDYEDDLRGAVAAAAPEAVDGKHCVRVALARPRN